MAQNIPFEKSLFKDRKDEYKAAKYAFETGDKKYDRGFRDEALGFYMQAQKFNPNNAELNFKIGKCLMTSYS